MPHKPRHQPGTVGGVAASRARVTAAAAAATQELARARLKGPLHKRAPERAKPLPAAPVGRLQELREIITRRTLTPEELGEMERLLREKKI